MMKCNLKILVAFKYMCQGKCCRFTNDNNLQSSYNYRQLLAETTSKHYNYYLWYIHIAHSIFMLVFFVWQYDLQSNVPITHFSRYNCFFLILLSSSILIDNVLYFICRICRCKDELQVKECVCLCECCNTTYTIISNIGYGILIIRACKYFAYLLTSCNS